MNLDFSKCKTPEDIKKVLDQNAGQIKRFKEIRRKFRECFPVAGTGKKERST